MGGQGTGILILHLSILILTSIQFFSSQFTATPLLTSAKADGPYINYVVDKIPLAEEVLKIVYGSNDQWGNSADGNGRTIVVEYR